MTEILAAVIGALGVIIVAIVGAVGASKLGVGTNQEKLVATLKDLITAQDHKIDELTQDKNDAALRINTLENKVKELETLTVNQARMIDRLQQGTVK